MLLHVNGLPKTITVRLEAGEHKGRFQLSANYRSPIGTEHRIVAEAADGLRCQRDETWVLRPVKSPNGHVVFCHPVHRLLTARGVHPIVEQTREHIEAGHRIAVLSLPAAPTQWCATATLVNVTNDNEYISVEYKDAKRYGDRKRSCPPMATNVLKMPLVGAEIALDYYDYRVLFCRQAEMPEMAGYAVRFLMNDASNEQTMPENILFGPIW